jgi:hypothetical protein
MNDQIDWTSPFLSHNGLPIWINHEEIVRERGGV